MPNWTNMSLEKLKAATKLDIIKAIGNYLNDLTKKQIIELFLDDVEVPDHPIIEKYSDGQLKNRRTIVRDVLGSKLRTRIIDWSYYKSGEVDIISVKDYDLEGICISDEQIKHFLGGRQPRRVRKH